LRTGIIVWVVVLFVTGLAYSFVLSDMDSFIAGNPFYRDMLLAPTGLLDQIIVEGMTTAQISAQINAVLGAAGLSIVQLFANVIGFMMAMITAIPVLMFILKAKSEEKAIRTELLVATPTSKIKYLMGFVLISFASAVLIQVAQAVGLYSMTGSVLENPEYLPLSFLMQSVLVYVPALWVMGGITVLLVGLLPRRTWLVWVYYGFTFFAMMYGRMLPDIAWIANLTPLGWVPQLPMDDISWPVLVVKTVLGITLAVVGIICYRRRDVNVL